LLEDRKKKNVRDVGIEENNKKTIRRGAKWGKMYRGGKSHESGGKKARN